MSSPATVQQRVSVNCVRFSRLPQAPDCALRNFEADVELADELTGESTVIGTINGWLGWQAWLPELVDNGQAIGSVAELMVAAAIDVGERLARTPGTHIQAVLLVDTLELLSAWRGYRLGRQVAEQLIDLLLFTPETTLVVTHLMRPPEVFGGAGFEQWHDSGVWWATLGNRTPAG